MRNLSQRQTDCLHNLETYSNSNLIFKCVALSLGAKYIVFLPFLIFIIGTLTHIYPSKDAQEILNPFMEMLKTENSIGDIIYIIVIAPVIETLIGQALIIELLVKLRVKQVYAVIISAAFFTILHFNILSTMWFFFTGIVLAGAYLARSKRSRIEAVGITTIMHSLINTLNIFIIKLLYMILVLYL